MLKLPKLLLSALCLAAFPVDASHAAGDASADAGIFSSFADALWAAFGSGMRFADDSNRRRLVRFLNQLNVPLTALRREKQTIVAATQRTDCRVTRVTPTAISSAPVRVRPILTQLAASSRTLETAVRPHGFRAGVREFTEGLESLQGQKFWLDELRRYCDLSAPQRNRLRNDLVSSQDAVRKAQVSLDRLIENLNRR